MSDLVIAVHPDDETLGAGGTLLKRKKQGKEIDCIIVTALLSDKNILGEKAKEVEKAKAKYGFRSLNWLKMPATKLTGQDIPEIIMEIDKVVLETNPTRVYIPWEGDIHSDHRITAQACKTLLKPHRYPFIKEVLVMEILSETDLGALSKARAFQPNYFADITETIDEKLRLLDIYQSETRDFPFPRSKDACEALAKYRGQMVGVKYAEAFFALKMVEK